MKKEKKSRWYLNKYLIAFVIFAVWMVFFDNNSMIHQLELKKKLTELQNDTTHYQEETRRFQSMTQSLNTDIEILEKLGREEYRMKRDDEVVYLIQKK
ncbi:MAG: septum formation initiator family protein [Bacteroidales bacterium]|nr:septum formation initiator family protein [Bacteroidales bacterium]